MRSCCRRIGVSLLVGLALYVALSLCIWLWQDVTIRRPEVPQAEILADFYKTSSSFFFGLATAPAHVEDELDDAWVEFAQSGKVRAWKGVPRAAERLRFWSEPETELALARAAGAAVFRLGVDWGRLVPSEPVDGTPAAADAAAVAGYRRILAAARERGMRVMLTLFHHSLPKWAAGYGGWLDPRTAAYFGEFAAYAGGQFGDLVDFWVTFNEPHIFCLLTYCSGAWPPGVELRFWQLPLCASPWGDFGVAMRAMTEAHKLAYAALRGGASIPVGVAHHVGRIRPFGLLDAPLALVSAQYTHYAWMDKIVDHLDFCGLNYYGQEVVSWAGLHLADDEEYSEAGRGVYPDGFYDVLLAFHARYRHRRPGLAYVITENGISDGRDVLRRPYLIEHLLALHAALQQGAPVLGYIHWTLADNWEWADGYCPKFGLMHVDRAHNNLTRHPRPSYLLFKDIASKGIVSAKQREDAWEALQREVRQGETHPFCRATDKFGRMGAQGLDVAVPRPLANRDWRFGHYTLDSLVTLALHSLKVPFMLLSDLTDLICHIFGWCAGEATFLYEPQGSLNPEL